MSGALSEAAGNGIYADTALPRVATSLAARQRAVKETGGGWAHLWRMAGIMEVKMRNRGRFRRKEDVENELCELNEQFSSLY